MNAPATPEALDTILCRLDAKSVGPDQWQARCPAHDDSTPSLSIGLGDDRVLLRCHAGCTADAVVAKLGLAMSDLFLDRGMGRAPHRRPRESAGANKPKPKKKTHPTLDVAVNAARWGVGQQAGVNEYELAMAGRWLYRHADGTEAFWVVRFDLPNGDKQIRPIRAVPAGGYQLGDPPKPLPLYNLPALFGNDPDAGGGTTPEVFVVEGEKCAEAARAIGLTATTSAHGAKSADKSDWSPLAGRDVVILPDNDAAGRGYARDVADRLLALTPPARVRIVDLPGLADGQDLADFLDQRRQGGAEDFDDRDVGAEVYALAARAAPVEGGHDDEHPASHAEFGGGGDGDDDDGHRGDGAHVGDGGDEPRRRKPGAWEPDHLSQQVNAERLVELLGGDAHFHVNQGAWVWFDGRRFVEDARGRVARAAKRVARDTWRFVREGLRTVDSKTAFKHAQDSEKATGIAAMMTLARTEVGISATADDFDADPYLFNCLNGTLDLRTGTLRPHRRADRLTKVAPVHYDPAAPRPLFDAFIDRIMGGNRRMVDYLARVLGLCLSGDVSVQELYFFIGEGANGKSVLVDTVLGLLGAYATVAPESLLLLRAHPEHATEIADLCGRRLVVASETEEGAQLKVQLVKRLTGDQRLKGRFMRQDFFEFDRTHKLVIVSNNRPVIRETKHAIWRRVRLVPFEVIIPEPERDTQLTEKLKAEWPGILSWLVAGYMDVRANGMQTPDEVRVATAAYQAESDPLAEYLAERCLLGAGRVTRGDLFADYGAWCQRAGERHPLGRNALFEHVRQLKGVTEDQWRVSGSEAPVRGFRGISLARAGTSADSRGVADWGDHT